LLKNTIFGASAQGISYDYDAAGNRIARRVIVLNAAPAPRSDRQTAETDTLTALTDKIGKQDVKIYPNPTQGFLAVEFVNFSDELQAEISISSLSGTLVVGAKTAKNYQTFDLSAQPAGVYLLRVRIDSETATWKINLRKTRIILRTISREKAAKTCFINSF
jgi:hypothetical protein